MMISSPHAHQANDWFTNNIIIHHMIDKQKMFHNFQKIPKMGWLPRVHKFGV